MRNLLIYAATTVVLCNLYFVAVLAWCSRRLGESPDTINGGFSTPTETVGMDTAVYLTPSVYLLPLGGVLIATLVAVVTRMLGWRLISSA